MVAEVSGRKVHQGNYRKCSIDDYVHDAGLIWPADKKRSVFDLWCYVLNHAAKLGEAIRREEYAEAGHEVGRVAVWLFSFIARLQAPTKKAVDSLFFVSTPLSEIIWNKYPNCCPVCYESRVVIPQLKGKDVEDWNGSLRTCRCMLRLEAVERRKEKKIGETEREVIRRRRREYAERVRPKGSKAFSLDDLENMYFNIFQPAITALTPESIGFHFLEEVGEVSEALTLLYTFREKEEATRELYELRKLEVENEIADVFSWLFAVSSKLRLIYEKFDRSPKRLYPGLKVSLPRYAPQMRVSKRIWAEYATRQGGFGCRRCGLLTCICRIFLATKKEDRDVLLGR